MDYHVSKLKLKIKNQNKIKVDMHLTVQTQFCVTMSGEGKSLGRWAASSFLASANCVVGYDERKCGVLVVD